MNNPGPTTTTTLSRLAQLDALRPDVQPSSSAVQDAQADYGWFALITDTRMPLSTDVPLGTPHTDNLDELADRVMAPLAN